jgi:dCTP deaminase
MILSKNEIDRQVRAGRIRIAPYDASRLNPVSYNYRLGTELIEVPCDEEWYKEELVTAIIPKDGYLLRADQLYLANTEEEIGSDHYVVSLTGRSSIGRLGLFVQISADLGNLGASHRWTLELHCIQPIKVYPRMTIGQVSFWRPAGKSYHYSGVYSAHSSPTPNLHSRLES